MRSNRHIPVWALVCTATIMIAGCTSTNPHAAAPAVTASAATTSQSAAESTKTDSGRPPVPPPNAACKLLTPAEVSPYFDGGDVPPARGLLSARTNGASGTIMDVTICNWEQITATASGVNIQVETETTDSVPEAKTEYTALLAAIIQNTAPGRSSVPVDRIGVEAAQAGQWVVAYKGKVVLSVTVSPAAKQPQPIAAMLDMLARDAAAALGW
jgi:Protein of unknown function (DUF3558)